MESYPFLEAVTSTKAKPQVFFSGRYFTAEEIKQVQETVRMFSALSWHELSQTICEHLDWVTPTGENRGRSPIAL